MHLAATRGEVTSDEAAAQAEVLSFFTRILNRPVSSWASEYTGATVGQNTGRRFVVSTSGHVVVSCVCDGGLIGLPTVGKFEMADDDPKYPPGILLTIRNVAMQNLGAEGGEIHAVTGIETEVEIAPPPGHYLS